MKLKFFFLVSFTLSLAPHYVPADGKPTEENEYVKCEIVLQHKEMKAGSTGYVLISFRPKNGIHITTDPPFRISLDTLQRFFTLGKALFSKDARGYLNSHETVRQSFTIAKTVTAGTYTLGGTLIYYYCSENDRWCSRFKQPIALSLTIAK